VLTGLIGGGARKGFRAFLRASAAAFSVGCRRVFALARFAGLRLFSLRSLKMKLSRPGFQVRGFIFFSLNLRASVCCSHSFSD
jgi:hypothetical protein